MAAKLTLLEDGWTRQPPSGTKIDWSNPINNGLVFCAEQDGSGFFDAVSSSLSSRSPEASLVVGQHGKAVKFSGSQTDGSISFGPKNPLLGATAATIIIRLAPNDISASDAKPFAAWAGAGSNVFLVQCLGGGNLGIVVGDSSGARSGASANVFVTNGEYVTVAFTWVAPNTKMIFVNGYPVTTSDWVNSNTVNAISGVPQNLQFGRAGDGGSFVGGVQFCRLFNRRLSNAEILSISQNPWQIFEPEEIPLFKPVVTAQYARPTSDVSAGTWTASTGSDLFAMLDETYADDGDYITSTTASTCEVALGSLSDPALSTGHIVRYRISATGGGIIVRLREGTTTIASWTHDPAPGSLTTYAQTLSGGEADSITNYAALKLQFEAIT